MLKYGRHGGKIHYNWALTMFPTVATISIMLNLCHIVADTARWRPFRHMAVTVDTGMIWIASFFKLFPVMCKMFHAFIMNCTILQKSTVYSLQRGVLFLLISILGWLPSLFRNSINKTRTNTLTSVNKYVVWIDCGYQNLFHVYLHQTSFVKTSEEIAPDSTAR